MKKKLFITFVVCGLSCPFLLIGFRQIAMFSTTQTCGRIVSESIVKGHSSFDIIYKVDGKLMTSGISSFTFKTGDLNELRKVKCIRIEYSNYFPSYIGILDTVVGSGQHW